MKAVNITDIHVHNYKAHDVEGSRLEHCLRAIDETFKLCLERGINVVLFGGDLYDQQKALPTVVVNAVISRFTRWFKGEGAGIVWYGITGNHDQASKSLVGKDAVSALEHIAEVFPEHFLLIDNSAEVIITHTGGTAIVGIPYYEFAAHYKEALLIQADKIKAAKSMGLINSAVLLIHQTPSGLPNPNIPVDTDIMDSAYDCFDLVLCGHIHQRMQLADFFWLTGSPLHRDLGDVGQDKGVLIVNLADPSDCVEYVSWGAKFPHFTVYKESDVAVGTGDNEYAIIKPAAVALTKADEDVAERFSADQSPAQLLTNYWEQVDGEDKNLLQIGLQFI